MKATTILKTLGLTAALVITSQTTFLLQQSKVLAEPGSNKLNNGESLKPNEFLVSSNGLYQFYLQGNGNLVAKKTSDGLAYWSSGTGGTYANRLTMQGDNNLVLYRDNTPIWNADNTWGGEPGSFLKIENDGKAVVYKPTSVWSTSAATPTPKPTPTPQCPQQEVNTNESVRQSPAPCPE